MNDDPSRNNPADDPDRSADPAATPDGGRRAVLERLGKLVYTAPVLMTLVVTRNARAASEQPPGPPGSPTGSSRARR
jgi:hypothetical protein